MRFVKLVELALVLSFLCTSVSLAQNCDWTGTWSTSFNKMVLQQSGNTVTGTYDYNGGQIQGIVSGNNLVGSWTETSKAGIFDFTMANDCNSFSGNWRYDTSSGWSGSWSGTRTSAPSIGTVNAQIERYYFPTGDWYRGSNQGGANLDIINTGDVGHLFWVKYSVMDHRGQWYDANLQSVYLNPGEETNGSISFVWPIPDGAALGNCQGRFTVWGGYDENADSVYNLLDEQDLAAAFRIVG